ncbi:iron chaperone [Microbacterium sp. SLBN-146]|uniref:iron chaperone n=1 Tax=Microbacterium sp. SLBN-146 TaxID=2768457 RepID=UPI0011545BAC|nr:DUF1801 domain-containing protein [Microbacterium sp. SLBN-146]TQJ31205.1 uncharacterized protein YdhG (YjbR/CyaY superfamily) [Microbacterium sp. SLBN-146]
MGTVDDLLTDLDPADRVSIARIYDIAREEVPEAEQGLGYGMPALLYRGKPLLSVMRAKKHIGVYPFSPASVTAVADAVGGVPLTSVDKGTIRYQPEEPLPDDIVRALVISRKNEIDG